MPPRLHDLVEVERETVAAPRFAVARREVTKGEFGVDGPPDEPVTGIDPAQLTEGKLLRSGFIALQAEGHPIDFRNVRLLNLEGCMDPKASTYKRYYVKSNPAACH